MSEGSAPQGQRRRRAPQRRDHAELAALATAVLLLACWALVVL